MSSPITAAVRQMLIANAEHYETAAFLDGDPSRFMHHVDGALNREAMAFIASSLSYGSRQQFLPKIEHLRQMAAGDVHDWIATGGYAAHFGADDRRSFYRLYSYAQFRVFLDAYGRMMRRYGSLGGYLRGRAATGLEAVECICGYFAGEGVSVIIPKDTTSACKRLCMFLRWMVRAESPVDLGLWADFIDRRSLVMPLDTHVLQQAQQLGLISSRTATMRTAQSLTATLAQVFPDDPLKADFALFGYGVEHD